MSRPRHSVRSHPAWAPWVFASPFIGVFALFLIWPLIQSLVLAFQQSHGPAFTVFVGWSNFRFMLADDLFWKALRNTALFTAGSVCLQVPAALGLALLLDRPGLKGKAWFRLAFFAPSLVGIVFVAMIFYLLFQIRTGLINSILHAVFPAFDPDFAWLQEHVMLSLIIASLWMSAGFNMIYFLAALQNVPRELTEAAAIDGAGPWQRFLHVTLPGIRHVTGFVVLISVVHGFQLFELPWVMFDNSAGPDNRALTVVMYLYRSGFQLNDLGYASAIGWMLAVLLMTFTFVQRRVMAKGEE